MHGHPIKVPNGSRPDGSRWWAALAVVLVAGSASAWSVGQAVAAPTSPRAPVTTTAPAPLRISMFGDSVMLGARDDLLASFPGDQVTVDAAEDRSLLGAVDMLRPPATPLGDVVVLDLGYNDASDPAVFRGRIDSMMAVLANVPHVVWFTQHAFTPERAPMNQELVAAQARFANLGVVDWDAEVAAHPDDVYGDGIHLTPTGRAAFAAVTVRSVDAARAARAARAAPTTTRAPVPTSVAPATEAADTGARAADTEESTGRRTLLAAVIGIAALAILGAAALSTRRLARAPNRMHRTHW
jgi:hypothetical protein